MNERFATCGLRKTPRRCAPRTATAIWAAVRARASQVPAEFILLLGDLLRFRPVNLMEIGTDRGATFRAFGMTARPGGVKISLDLPQRGLWPGVDIARVHREMPRWFPGVRLIHADSHHPRTLTRVKEVLRGRMLDFLFIDGDHSYEGVKMDFEMYSPLVRPGGLIGFHDIIDSARYPQIQVARFWRELAGVKREYVAGWNWGGIGVFAQQPHLRHERTAGE